jgi:hypothetical protein
LALLASWRFDLATPARAESEAKKPYQLQVVLHVAEHRLLTDVFRDRVERELRDGLQASLGELAKVEVVREHPRLKDVLDKGLQKALDDWKERSEVKTHFVLIDFSGSYYEIQARQQDGLTGQASPVVRRDRTLDRDFVARSAALLVDRDFGLVGTVVGPAGGTAEQELFKVELRGAGLDVPLDRWVKKGEVFAVAPAPPGNGRVDALSFALLQVQELPKADSRDGVCICRFFHRHKVGSIAGYRCLKLATIQAPLRLHLAELKPDGSTTTLSSTLTLEVRRHGFDQEESTKLQRSPDTAGVFDAVKLKLGGSGVFENVAFVTVLSGKTPVAKVPVALVEDRIVPLAVQVPKNAGDLFAFRKETWQRSVADSFLVQVSVFKEVNDLGAKAATRGESLKKAKAGLQRTRDDYARLSAERDELLKEAKQAPGGGVPDLSSGDKMLAKLKAGEEELQGHITRVQQIEDEEKDPKRQEWLGLVEQGKLLEKDFEYGKALALYRKVLKEGFRNDTLQTHVAELEKTWNTADEKLNDARSFIYDVWPGLDTAGLYKKMDEAEKAFAACRDAKDYLGPRKMLKAAEAHVLRLDQELKALNPRINFDDEKPAEQIKELLPRLETLIRDVEIYLKKAPAPDK